MRETNTVIADGGALSPMTRVDSAKGFLFFVGAKKKVSKDPRIGRFLYFFSNYCRYLNRQVVGMCAVYAISVISTRTRYTRRTVKNIRWPALVN